MGSSGLDEAQAGIKIAGRNVNILRNINNLRYASDTNSMKMKEESEKFGLKLNV